MKYPSSICSLIASVCLLSLLPTSIAQPAVVEVDVVIYGGTPGGIAAAVAAGKQGRDVLLVEPYRRVGGLTTNGLSHTDFHSHEGLSGAFLDFSRRAEPYYISVYGPGSAQAKECRRGTQVEPHVNQLVFERMLDTYPSIRVHIYRSHVLHNVGLLYFLQNDKDVPPKFREEACEFGWCKDEFTDTGHIPEQLYVREGRRMIGQHIYTQRDTEYASDDSRSILHRDAIAMGEYSHNCHGTDHEGPQFGGRHTGEFYLPIAPYQIPYGVILPKRCENLLVPVACSSSHVGFCALRLEPIWMSLGQAAGHAAVVAIDSQIPVQDVNVQKLQQRLIVDRSAMIYIGDVSPESDDFAAVQWWGTQSGLHGLNTSRKFPPRTRERFPDHDVELGHPLDDKLHKQWLAMARSLDLQTDSLIGAKTRGEFIHRAFELARHRSSGK